MRTEISDGDRRNEALQTVSPGHVLSPQNRLRLMAERFATVAESEHGVGYRCTADGRGELIFTDLKNERLVTMPTRISREDLQKILEGVIPLAETRFMLFELAQAYSQGTPIMFEGGTAIGKTFVVSTFAKLLYGPRAEIPDFYCSGQTDASELIGKYVPAGVTPADHKRVSDFLKSEQGAALKAELQKENRGKFQVTELYRRALVELQIPFDKGAFEFQLGVLPKAMTATISEQGVLQNTPDGPGVMLHVQEIGLAPPGIINVLLKVRGDAGKLTESIQIWEDGGCLINAGPDFFVVFSTNPAGKGFHDRFTVDPALARFVVWVNLPDQLSEDSLRRAAQWICTFKKLPASDSTVIDLADHKELAGQVAEVLAKFHQVYVQLLDKGEPSRQQKVPATIDSMWRAARLIQEVQVSSDRGGSIDMVATIRGALTAVYINALQDKPSITPNPRLSEARPSSLGSQLLRTLDSILTDETTQLVSFRGSMTTREKIIDTLAREAMRGGGNTDTVMDELREFTNEAEAIKACNKMVELLKELRNSSPDFFDDMLKSTVQALDPSVRKRVEDALSQNVKASLENAGG